MLAVALTLAVQGVPTPQQHVLNEMRDIDVVLKALLGDVKLERESATAKFLSTQATKNVDEKLSFEEFADKILAFETDPVPTEEELRARFAAVDINLDGFITKEEYLQAIRTHALWELTLSGGKVEETDLFDEGRALTVTAVANAMRTESRAYAMDPKPTGPFPVAALDDAAYDVVMAFVAEVKAGAATQDPPYDQLVFWSGLYEKQGVAAQQLFHATHGAGRTRGDGQEYTTVETAGVGKYFTEPKKAGGLGFGSPPALKAEIKGRVEEALSVTLEDAQLNVAFKSMWDAFSIDFAARLGNGNQNLPVNVFLRWAPGFESDVSKDAARQMLDPTPPLEADYFSEMAALRSKTFGNFEGPIVLAALYERKIEVVNIHFIDDDGIAALCKALAECCPHVRKLKLRMNPVGTLSAKWLIWLLHYNPELVELDVDRADLGTLYDDIGHIVELMPHEREALETLPPPDAQDPGRDSKEGPKKAQEAVKKNRDYDTSNLPEWALKEKRIADAGEAGDQAKVQEILDEYNKKDAATYEDKLQQRAERAAQRAVERARAAGELPAPDTVTTPLELPDLTPEARRATRELIKSEL